MEIFFSILAAIFGIVAGVFGVKHRLGNRITGNSRSGTRSNLRDARTRYTDALRRDQLLDRAEERLQEYSDRDTGTSERCKDIGSRIRKREPEADDPE